MSELSNRFDSSPAEVQAYVKSLLDLLGDREPIAVLESTPGVLERRLANLDDTAVRRPETRGKWSVLQVVQHLADSELVVGYRLRVILAEDDPVIPAYDQDRWAERLRYAEASQEEALEQFRLLRRLNLRIWRRVTPEDFQRSGVHSERGVETLDQLLHLYAAHDLVHLRQIARILDRAAA